MLGILTIAGGLTACGGEEEEGQKTLVLAAFDTNPYLAEKVEEYNQLQQECKIEIQKYERSEVAEEDGILLLQREIASGKGPDLIDFGSGYNTGDIVGAYTENLFPYMAETDCLENIMEAFSYGENLYAVPLSFTMKSFAGTTENLGERNSWTIGEMMDCYYGQEPEKLLYPGVFKKDVLGTILTGSMEYYIDWETGECRFDGEEFSDMLEFCNQFSDHLEITEDFSVKRMFLEDAALLLPVNIRDVYDICRVGHIFGEKKVTFVGFPIDGKNGTMLQSTGPVLAISRNSRQKEVAWDFLSWLLDTEAQRELPFGFPVCRSVLEEQISKARETEYAADEEGKRIPVVREQVLFEGEEPVDIYSITQEQAEQLMSLIEAAEAASLVEPRIYHIFLEEADYYFNGDKSLEETVDVIQSRVSVYVSEKIQ